MAQLIDLRMIKYCTCNDVTSVMSSLTTILPRSQHALTKNCSLSIKSYVTKLSLVLLMASTV